jgi:hypothetical protein
VWSGNEDETLHLTQDPLEILEAQTGWLDCLSNTSASSIDEFAQGLSPANGEREQRAGALAVGLLQSEHDLEDG